jgi:hypothetical protein
VPGFCVANFWHRQQRVGTNRVGQDRFVHARSISALWRRRFGFGVSERLGRREQNHLLQMCRSGAFTWGETFEQRDPDDAQERVAAALRERSAELVGLLGVCVAVGDQRCELHPVPVSGAES